MRLSPKALLFCGFLLLILCKQGFSQSSQLQTQLKVKQLTEKKAEYNRLTGGVQKGYRIKIHSGVDSDKMKAVTAKFSARFNEYATHEDYQQPYFVVLIGDFMTKLEAVESLNKIKSEFPGVFIVRCDIQVK